jgi:hypothetical protein
MLQDAHRCLHKQLQHYMRLPVKCATALPTPSKSGLALLYIKQVSPQHSVEINVSKYTCTVRHFQDGISSGHKLKLTSLNVCGFSDL